MTRAERRERNREAHAIRRARANGDYRAARAAGQSDTWSDFWDLYAAMNTDAVIALGMPEVEPRRKRKIPAHLVELHDAYMLTRHAWELQLEAACRGHLGGEEEAEFRATHPAPTWRAFLTQHNADRREESALARL